LRVHIHKWQLSGKNWKCTAPDHVHDEPDILDAATVWHVLGVIRTHKLINKKTCECGWQGVEYMEHLDDAVFYWLRDIDGSI
jgi:hypothetical protein